MENKKIIIVGGGVTGLATAYILSKSHKNITLLESAENIGGLLNTFPIGDNRLECYYHHFFTHDKEINWLIRDLGLADKLVYKKTNMGTFRDGKIYNFSTPTDILRFKPLNLWGKLMFVLTSLFLGKFAKWEKYESVSALRWFYTWAGKNVTHSIWKPLLKVKFGTFYDKIPLAWMIGRLRQRMLSREKNDEYLGYLDGSLAVLLNALLEKLQKANVSIQTNIKIEDLLVDDGTIVGVRTQGNDILADKVVLTIPSAGAAKLIMPHNTNLARKIAQVDYFGAICLIIELDRQLSHIYWLNIADEGYPFGGIIEHTNFISEENYNMKHIVYLSRYFARDEDVASMNDEQIKELMLPKLKQIYQDFDETRIKNIHIFKTHTAAPVCDLDFSQKVVSAKLPIKNLYLANMMHIYPDERSVNNSIRVAAELAKTMGYPAEFVPEGNSMSAKIGFE